MFAGKNAIKRMRFLDFLKKLIPDIKIDNRKIDNRKIIITNSNVIFGDQNIKDKDTINKLFGEIKKNKDAETLPFQLVHKDIEEDFLDYEEISIKEKGSLNLLKKVLPAEEVECILMARRVVLAYEKNQKELGKGLMAQLDKVYPTKGRRVFNLISAKYFDEIILPFIEIFRTERGDEKYIAEFRKFYADILEFFPLAIFVNNFTTEEDIELCIKKRLQLDIPFIRIHAIAETNIGKVENVTHKLKIDKGYTIKDNRFNAPTGLKAQIYEIKLK